MRYRFGSTQSHPVLAGQLVVACSLIAQGQTLPSIWHKIDFKRALAFIAWHHWRADAVNLTAYQGMNAKRGT